MRSSFLVPLINSCMATSAHYLVSCYFLMLLICIAQHLCDSCGILNFSCTMNKILRTFSWLVTSQLCINFLPAEKKERFWSCYRDAWHLPALRTLTYCAIFHSRSCFLPAGTDLHRKVLEDRHSVAEGRNRWPTYVLSFLTNHIYIWLLVGKSCLNCMMHFASEHRKHYYVLYWFYNINIISITLYYMLEGIIIYSVTIEYKSTQI